MIKCSNTRRGGGGGEVSLLLSMEFSLCISSLIVLKASLSSQAHKLYREQKALAFLEKLHLLSVINIHAQIMGILQSPAQLVLYGSLYATKMALFKTGQIDGLVRQLERILARHWQLLKAWWLKLLLALSQPIQINQQKRIYDFLSCIQLAHNDAKEVTYV